MKNILIGGAILLLPYFLFSQSIPFQQGWPVYVNAPKTSSIKIADIDNDKFKEIIFGDNGDAGQPNDWWLYVKSYNGLDKYNWPINNAGSMSSPAVEDLDGDGKLEIIKTCSGIAVWKYDGTLLWREPYNGEIFQSKYLPIGISIDDLDNDGIKEIVVTCYSGGAVFVFEPDGTVRDGWPVLIPPHPGYSPPPIFNPASIGDIDKDGLKEIVVGIDDGTAIEPSHVYCFKPNGSFCPGFPVGITNDGYRSQAILIDVDKDGYLEILIGKLNDELNLYRHDCSIFPGYPLPYLAEGISVGDINFDSNFEFVSMTGPYIMAWQLHIIDLITLQELPNFPIPPLTDSDGTWRYSGSHGPNLCDLSDSFGEEIVTGASSGSWVSDGKLFAFDLKGQIVEGFPSQFLYHRALNTGCSVDDLDGDGDIEICCGSENDEWVIPRHSNVFCWDSPHPWNRDLADWMMDGFDLQNTGRWRKLYHIDEVQSTIEVDGCSRNPCILPADGNLYEVKVKAKRKFADEYPSGQDVRYSRTLGCGNYEGPVIDNGDGTYIRYLRAPTGECQTTIEGWVNEFKVDSCIEITFKDCSGNLGDVNLNNQISSMDASIVLQNVVGTYEFSTGQLCIGDVNRNGIITSLDASYILQCSIGLCTNLPPEFLNSCTSHGNCI